MANLKNVLKLPLQPVRVQLQVLAPNQLNSAVITDTENVRASTGAERASAAHSAERTPAYYSALLT